jgi:ABC-2 type transport system permease protein
LRHILRDRSSFFLVLISPAIMLLIMSYALAVDIEHVPLAVLDNDRSALSGMFIQQINAGEEIDLYSQVSSMQEVEGLLMRGEVKAAMVIPPTFSDQIYAMEGMPLQIIIDGTEPTGGWFAVDQIVSRMDRFAGQVLTDRMQAMGLKVDNLQPIDLRIRTWYNPGMKTEVAVIPGLLTIVLGFPALSVALTLAREREHGTMEQLMATPISKFDLLIGKTIPYVVIGMFNVVFLQLLAMLLFGVPFRGNYLLYLGLSSLFLLAVLSLGIIIGVFTRTQPAALALSFLVIFFPGFFLTGIFFPINAMPEIMRLESLFLPGTQFAIITRGLFLTGVGLEVLWPYAVMLVVLWLVFTSFAALFFKKKLA